MKPGTVFQASSRPGVSGATYTEHGGDVLVWDVPCAGLSNTVGIVPVEEAEGTDQAREAAFTKAQRGQVCQERRLRGSQEDRTPKAVGCVNSSCVLFSVFCEAGTYRGLIGWQETGLPWAR